MAPIEYLPEQGRKGIRILPPGSNDHLAPDTDVYRKIVILVYPPLALRPGVTPTARDLHWSLSWRVKDGWRHIHINAENTSYDPQLPRRYVYWGPITKSSGYATSGAKEVPLGYMSLAMRRRIEQLAWSVQVARPNGQWNCQNWIVDLLCKMHQDGIITQSKWSQVVAEAPHVWDGRL
ncbi:hypothetical protein L226DRAFT_496274 [Lentinus tigrinus ALCF2SS1-7]|uniref:Uncharacterized protein n=1 Tax=Lentinus tigrinus ALCF2SS1-6 TaxID=1328759 RepID=A0A5C2RL80_9APHY|nr:hypothetical protein L227DRAFT_51974 [Lentinus tigrinus ALCF2SS1-6]RPD67927.1 hypothetical protein L226DRAFT_496274 [Lentinus tigrinus ALCF2SS1-7]